jgi:hypothetical protein
MLSITSSRDSYKSLFGLAERAGAGFATEHEEAEIGVVDDRGAINQLTCLVVVIERLSREVDIVSEGITRALHENEVVQQGERASEGPGV